MESSNPNNEYGLYLTVEPISGRVHAVFETGLFLKFDDLADLRTYCCALMEEANKLENHLASMAKPKRDARGITKRYANKAIKEWEEQVQTSTVDPKDDRSGRNYGGDVSPDTSN